MQANDIFWFLPREKMLLKAARSPRRGFCNYIIFFSFWLLASLLTILISNAHLIKFSKYRSYFIQQHDDHGKLFSVKNSKKFQIFRFRKWLFALPLCIPTEKSRNFIRRWLYELSKSSMDILSSVKLGMCPRNWYKNEPFCWSYYLRNEKRDL